MPTTNPTEAVICVLQAPPERLPSLAPLVLDLGGGRRLVSVTLVFAQDGGVAPTRTHSGGAEGSAEGGTRSGEFNKAAHEDARPTVSEEVARSAFALLQKLELDAPLKAPSVLTVFRLYCVDGYSADQVARKCRCAKGTVMSRLRFIETVTRTRPEQFRAMSGHLQQLDEDLNASGARAIYRRGLVTETED